MASPTTTVAPKPKRPKPKLGFDDRSWPVNLTLVVLAGCVGGYIAARGDFETKDLWRNAKVQLVALGGIVAVVAAGAALLGRVMQRRMQLAVLASLLVHFWLSAGMHEYRLPGVAALDKPQERPEDLARTKLPDYHFENPQDRPEDLFDRPVETPLPEQKLPELTRKKPVEIEAKRRQREEPQPKPEVRPEPKALAKAEPSAPKRAEKLPSPDRNRPELANVRPSERIALERRQAAPQQPTAEPETSPDVRRQEQRVARAERQQVDLAEPGMKASRQPLASANRPEAQPNLGNAPAERLARRTPAGSPLASVAPLNEALPAVGSTGQTNAPGNLDAAAMPNVGRRTTSAVGSGPGFELGEPSRTPGVPGTGGGPSRAATAAGQPGLASGRAAMARSALGRESLGPGAIGSIAERSAISGTEPAAGAGATGAGDFETGIAQPGRQATGSPLAGIGGDGSAGRMASGLGGVAEPGGGGTTVGSPGAVGPFSAGGGLARASGGGGPTIGDLEGTPRLGRQTTAGLPGGIDAPAVPGGLTPGTGLSTGTGTGAAGDALDDDVGPRPRGEGAASIAGLARPETPGGLSDQPSVTAGVPSPLARAESKVVDLGRSRFILERSGGHQTVDARVRDTAVEGFKQRDREGRQAMAEAGGGGQGTERAVELGLDFLARHQSADGSWSLHGFGVGRGYANPGHAQMHSNTAGTGLALLSFLGAGYTHTDGKYRSVVSRGLEYLLAHQKPDGDLYLPLDSQSSINVWLYSHGIASIALGEAYGMTRDAHLAEPAQRALDFIVAAQSPEEGGWRYSPRRGSDTSVSGWQLMALKSGELAGLRVPNKTYAAVSRWLDHAQGAGGNPSRYAYRPLSSQPHQREPSRVMTAESLLMRQYLGWQRSNVNMIEGAQWLRENLPTIDVRYPQERDAYYWYYATQVMFQMQGDYWRQWNDQLRPTLLSNQVATGPLAGSWSPDEPVPDRWGQWGGRIYVTSLHLLMLEVYYRHLPIYRSLEEK